MLRQSLLISILYLISVPILFSQSMIDTKHYSIEEGLSQKNINSFVQDDNGYIWMSTWNGLERFDGYSFNNYKTYPGDSVRIANHRFNEIVVSSQNNIWCLTYDKHCYLFDTRNLKFIDPFLYNPNYSNSAERIYVLNGGISWIVDTENKLYRVDENKFPQAASIELFSGKSGSTIGDSIYDIMQDTNGDEWILTNKGTIIIGEKKMINLIPFEFIGESAGEIFLATSKGLFARYDTKMQNTQPYVLPQEMERIMGMKILPDGKVAILQSNEIILYDPIEEMFSYHTIPVQIKPDVYQDSKGNIWLMGVSGGVVLIDSVTGESNLLKYTSTGNNSYSFIHEDVHGSIWIKPTDGEFSFYNPESFLLEQAFIYDQGIENKFSFHPNFCFIDQQQNLWYGDGEGIGYISFHQKSFEYIINNPHKVARGLMEDHQQRLWIGWRQGSMIRTGSLCLYDSLGQWMGNVSRRGEIVANRTVTFDTNIYCIYEDKEHNVWVGTKGNGLYLLLYEGPNKYKVINYMPDESNPYSISSESIYSILQDLAGHIWIATYGGGINIVEEYSKDGEVHFFHSGNILHNYPIHACERTRCLYETANGTILIGTTGGLLTCVSDFSRPNTIQFYHNICDERYASLSNNDVFDITQTRDGKIWITTLSGGINVLENDRKLFEKLNFTHYNSKNSQVSNTSLSVVEDLEGNIWIASENKLSKFDTLMHQLGEYTHQMQIIETKPILRASGKIVFASTFGALCVIPGGLQKSEFVPPVVYNDLSVYVNNVTYKKDISGKEGKVILHANERNFTVRFVALDYMNSEVIKYAYRIQGLSDLWIELGYNHSVSLGDLSAGKYLFQVRSTNANGVWVNNITSLSIFIEPTFTETIWAKFLYIIVGIIITLMVILTVIRITNLRRKIDFEQQLSNLKLQFFTDISHELRTPLTLISSPIDEVIDNEKLSKEGIENMHVAKRNTDRMLYLINQILDFRKIQNDKMRVLVEQTDVIPLILKTYENFTSMAHKRQIDYQWHCEIDSFIMYTDVDKLEKILFNILSNAFKYTKKEKSISLRITREKDDLCIAVKDEGCGIHSQEINALFTRFETLNAADPNISTGIGLSLVKKLLTLMHGTIEVESSLGKGSLFKVRLPGNYEIFSSDENAEFILNDAEETKFQVERANNSTDKKEKKIRVLIIEDNEELRHFIYSVLSKDYVVFEAENGQKGWEVTLAEMPDIVISDIMMPEMDGIEYLKKVKNNHLICHIPIILLSAKSSLSDQIQGLEYGADEYMTKPFSSTYLKVRVDSLLKQRQMLYNYYVSEKKERDINSIDQLMPSAPQVTHFDDNFIRKILQNVEENIQNPNFKIDDIAEAMSMSRTVFYRKVKSLIGVSPVEFLKNIRIKRAVQLLEQDEYSISEVGYLSGFTTPQYFSKVFKDVMKYTPKEYMIKSKDRQTDN